ncbi:MAG: hypothetical protein QUS11_04110 [Candidatus Fermentibacter sp.]|nr:hypothetical protein [Candidatus Fermentibacter sp.]
MIPAAALRGPRHARVVYQGRIGLHRSVARIIVMSFLDWQFFMEWQFMPVTLREERANIRLPEDR